MKVDETVRALLIMNIKPRADMIEGVMANYIHKLKTAKSVEALIKAKKQMLSELVQGMPIGTDSCYFCQKPYMEQPDTPIGDCELCEYGEVHKICLDYGSDWHNIFIAIKELQNQIRNYYKDENYSMVAKTMKARRLKV